ncbi:MAG: hypothetical protein LBC64_11425 [Fibromonadaceae bacterium]|jgi:hypothetical protein|nr:hypothetical protein [Fibromonadaceae bacterium]
MRSLCLIIILFALFAPIKSYATEQIPDYFIYKGKQYPFKSEDPLYPHLVKTGKWEWIDTKNYWCSSLAKGYYAIYEIVDNELAITYIGNCSISLLKGLLSAFNVKDSIFKLNWYTDSIAIGIDKPLYNDIHEYYSILHFEKGKFIKETRMGYKEYLSNRLIRTLKWMREESNIEYRIYIDTEKYSKKKYQENLEIMEHYLEIKKGDKSEFLTKLKTRYEKKIGKPMSDFELKIQRIEVRSGYELEIIRTLYGARVVWYFSENPRELIDNVKLNTEEWLDFIKALYTCCLDKWERVPEIRQSDFWYDLSRGTFYIYSSKNSPYDERYAFPFETRKANLEEFQKVMEDIIAKIREKPAEL